MSGIEQIAEERAKQVVKWGINHDSECHSDKSLANAAAYLAAAREGHPPSELGAYLANKHPDDRIMHLRIAGALCAAEIDRLELKQ